LAKKRGPDKRHATRRRSLPPLAIWGLIAAVAGTAAFLVVYAATSGGGNGSASTDFSAQTAQTPSDASQGQPFQGGPRLYFPVASMDLGQVPFNTPVSESFDLRNVGDAPLKIEDVQVKMLEGC
jgi:hypothetical protein